MENGVVDFESTSSTNSITLAKTEHIIHEVFRFGKTTVKVFHARLIKKRYNEIG